MGSPAIFNGAFSKLLTSRGILRSDGGLLEYDGPYNYINNGHFESGIVGVSTASCSFTNQFPSGTIAAGGGGVVLSWNSSTPLAGRGSLQAATSVNWGGGQGFVFAPFTVRTCDLGKVLNFSMDYSVTAGSSGVKVGGDVQLLTQTFIAYIYDVTAGAWLQPVGFASMNAFSGTIQGSFQSSVVAGQQYQLAFLAANGSTGGATTVLFDNVSVGRVANVSGAAMTDWAAYTPNFTGFGTPSNVAFKWRRNGGECVIEALFTNGASPTAVEGQISLPPGLTSASDYPTLANVGMGAGSADQTTVVLMEASKTYLTLGKINAATSGIAKQNGNGYAASVAIGFTARVRIQGWSSNVVQSSDSDTRVIAATVGLTSGQSVTAGQPIKYDTVIADSSASYSTSTGLYTVPVTGRYRISITLQGNTASSSCRLFVNGAAVSYLVTNSTSQVLSGSVTYPLNAGQTVSIVPDTTNGLAAAVSGVPQNTLCIERLSGPSVVQASESVNASYTNVAGTSIATSATKVPWATKTFDSHNAMSAAGDYTIPVSGKFSVTASLLTGGNPTTWEIQVYKNGASYRQLWFGTNAGGVATFGSGTALVDCVAGDVISIYGIASTANVLVTTAARNCVYINRVGN